MTDMYIQVMGRVRDLGSNNGNGFGFNIMTQTYRRDVRRNYLGTGFEHKIKATVELADWCKERLEDGALVFVEGLFKTEITEYENGMTRYNGSVIAEGIKCIDGKWKAN